MKHCRVRKKIFSFTLHNTLHNIKIEKVILELLDFMYIVQDDLKQLNSSKYYWLISTQKLFDHNSFRQRKVNITPP